MSSCRTIPSTRFHFMADTVLILTHRNKQAFQLRCVLLSKITHFSYNFTRFGRGLHTQAFVGNDHQFLCIDIPDHIDRCVLRSLSAVIFALPVIPLAFHIRLRVYVPNQVNRYPGRNFFEKKAVCQIADRGMPSLQDFVLPLTGRRRNSSFTDSNQRSFLYTHPGRFCRRVYQRYFQGFQFLSCCPFTSFIRVSPISSSIQMACSSICGGQYASP